MLPWTPGPRALMAVRSVKHLVVVRGALDRANLAYSFRPSCRAVSSQADGGGGEKWALVNVRTFNVIMCSILYVAFIPGNLLFVL